MASFDKKSAAASSGSKKKKQNIFAGVLAVVLAVVLVHHFTKAAPSEAAATGGGGGGASGAAGGGGGTGAGAPEAFASQATPESARAALDSDTRFAPLSFHGEGASALDALPTNDPFQLTQAWRDKLIKVVIQTAVVETNVVVPHVSTDTGNTKPRLPAWDPSVLKLTGIFRGNTSTYAVINGSIIKENMTIGGARVVEIADDHVTLQQLGAADSARVDLVINRPGMGGR